MLRLLGTLIVDLAVELQLIFWSVEWANWLGVILGIFLIPGVFDHLVDCRKNLPRRLFRVYVRWVVRDVAEARLAMRYRPFGSTQVGQFRLYVLAH